ncbi:NAD(P)H-dependent oxidoreductase [Iodidimonas sp. SYSU 1G8]|uniref:NAD(P)H-dependent oxidoreductase n=1 Tax=Iodidimonas sp. SYSU 1G8 TaxID=3133967 RepID=UPI0031FF0967
MAHKRIVVILAHPDPAAERLCRALAGAYVTAARAAGHEVDFIDLATLAIPLLSSQREFEHQPVPDSLRSACESIGAAGHLVLVFPLWLGTMPALLKAFLEQVMRPGIAFRYRDKGLPEKLWAGKSARLIVTMGMPATAYRWFYGAHGLKALKRNILSFVGFSPVSDTLFGMVEAAGPKTRDKWFAKVRRLGESGR